MERSHRPSPRATGSTRAPFGAPTDTQETAAKAAAHRPRTGEGPASLEPSGSPPSPRSTRPVDLANPADARAWLDDARAIFEDLAALAREGSRRLKHRVLSRAELRSQVRDAE